MVRKITSSSSYVMPDWSRKIDESIAVKYAYTENDKKSVLQGEANALLELSLEVEARIMASQPGFYDRISQQRTIHPLHPPDHRNALVSVRSLLTETIARARISFLNASRDRSGP